jgi:hypothetical protein
MQQIIVHDQSRPQRRLRDRLAEVVKWWAEHQAWPATDDIRIERDRSTCG